MGLMPTYVEVWPVAADKTGIWLCSGDDAWRPALPIEADSSPHAEVELELAIHGLSGPGYQGDDPDLIHSTSWRRDGPSQILTYLVLVHVDGAVRGEWPNARPIGQVLTDAVGKPPSHGPTEEPNPRVIDVLVHGLRHLEHLRRTNTRNAAAMNKYWHRHLSALEPALAGLYKLEAA